MATKARAGEQLSGGGEGLADSERYGPDDITRVPSTYRQFAEEARGW